MRLDSQGNMDFCRERFTPVNQEATELVRKIKLQTNALMAILHREYYANSHSEVKRMFYRSLEQFEDASMWAVKALTSEHRTGAQHPTEPQTTQGPSLEP